MTPVRPRGRLSDEARIGRFLIAATYVSVVLLVVGVVDLLAAGVSPLAGGPDVDLALVPGWLLGLEPVGFLWAGLLTVMATPIVRVALAAVAFAWAGDRQMVLVALGILVVVLAGVMVAGTGTV